jgi:hypothetical protein
VRARGRGTGERPASLSARTVAVAARAEERRVRSLPRGGGGPAARKDAGRGGASGNADAAAGASAGADAAAGGDAFRVARGNSIFRAGVEVEEDCV